MKERNPILVIGTGRSGTSVVAGVLFYLGIYMGQWFLKPDEGNPSGYFEDMEFGILDQNRVRGKLSKKEWFEKMDRLLIERKKIKGRWGWKQPSLSHSIEDVQKALKKAHLRPYFIHVRRDHQRTAESAARHFGLEKNDALNAVKVKEKWILDHLPINRTLIVDLELLRASPRESVEEIIDFIGIEPDEIAKGRAISHIIPPKDNDIHVIHSSLITYPQTLYEIPSHTA